MDIVAVDFETRSRADLVAEGIEPYLADAGFDVLCLGWEYKGTFGMWCPMETRPATDLQRKTIDAECFYGPDLPAPLAAAIQEAPVMAHNAFGFDALVWAKLGLPPVAWIDTHPLARMMGLPGGLEQSCEMLNMGGKDEAGKVSLKKFYAPNKKGLFHPFGWNTGAQVMHYCRRDVEMLSKLFHDHLVPALQSPDYPTVITDAAVNRFGYLIDDDRAHKLARIESFCRADVVQCAIDASDGVLTPTALRSPQKLRLWLSKAIGEEIEDCKKQTLEPLLEHPSEKVRSVVAGRLGISRISTSKLEKAQRIRGADGRIRHTLLFHGAHTGRWAGRKFQPHNLTRPKIDRAQADDAAANLDWVLEPKDRDEVVRRARFLADHFEVSTDVLIASLIRSCVVAGEGREFIDYDYSAIEARGVCWLAGDEPGLQVYRDGLDPYRVMAASLFGIAYDDIAKKSQERFMGKSLVLGAGFGIGPDKFRAFAEAQGVDFTQITITPSAAVDAYRSAHPAIAGVSIGRVAPNGTLIRKGGIWRDVEAAVKRVIETGQPEIAGRCEWSKWRDALVCTLPSGRRIHYRHAAIIDVVPSWGGKPRPQISYLRRPAYRVSTYGGKLTENITQAACRDLLAHALNELHGHGVEIALHIHDAIIAEADSSAAATVDQLMQDVMTTPPAWAEGFPIEIEGGRCRRFH